jgi:hypothetical protein
LIIRKCKICRGLRCETGSEWQNPAGQRAFACPANDPA